MVIPGVRLRASHHTADRGPVDRRLFQGSLIVVAMAAVVAVVAVGL